MGQLFSVNDFYQELLSYSRRFDCLQSIKLIESTTEDTLSSNTYQKTKDSSSSINVQAISTKYSTTSYIENNSSTYFPVNSSTINNNQLLPCQQNNNMQSTVLLATLIPGFLILLALVGAFFYVYRRKNNHTPITSLELIK